MKERRKPLIVTHMKEKDRWCHDSGFLAFPTMSHASSPSPFPSTHQSYMSSHKEKINTRSCMTVVLMTVTTGLTTSRISFSTCPILLSVIIEGLRLQVCCETEARLHDRLNPSIITSGEWDGKKVLLKEIAGGERD